MHYVKQFHINGVDTKQVACIELQGAPNAATEGAIGVLGMDMLSPTHEVYRCVGVNGSVYTWELLSAGMSIISSTITAFGAKTGYFLYSHMRVPNNYIIKAGDLILDSEGYLYQVESIGADACTATYCGTHIGGIASGDKDYSFKVVNGELQLVTEGGNVISNTEYMFADDDTITRNSEGVASVRGIKTIGDTPLHLFVGTKAEYDALTDAQKDNLFAIITDDTTKEEMLQRISDAEQIVNEYTEGLVSGSIILDYARTSGTAGTARNVEHLYYHSLKYTFDVMGMGGQSKIGEAILEVSYASPSQNFNADRFVPGTGATYNIELDCKGIYSDINGVVYDVVSYKYLNKDDADYYKMALKVRARTGSATETTIEGRFSSCNTASTQLQVY